MHDPHTQHIQAEIVYIVKITTVPLFKNHIHTQTDRVTTEGTPSGFQDIFLQPIIKDRPNNIYYHGIEQFYLYRFLLARRKLLHFNVDFVLYSKFDVEFIGDQ